MATIKAKVIRPKKLNERAMRAALLTGLKEVAKDVDEDFAKTYSTWKRKPEFETEVELNSRRGRFAVMTEDEIYRYVDEGTKPHIIRPKRASRLYFQAGYSAKTTPRVIGAKQGGASGPEVYAKAVQHPGTKAREFAKTLAKKYKRTFGKSMQKAMDKAAKKSGHGK